jgi:hypothetical protein
MSLIPTQVTFRGFQPSDVLESDVRNRVEWLEQFYSGIVRCRVLLEVPHRHSERGRRLHVRIELTVGDGPPIVVSHAPSPIDGDEHSGEHRKAAEAAVRHRDARTAVHDAFDAARRQLEDFSRQQRHTHHVPHRGRAPA